MNLDDIPTGSLCVIDTNVLVYAEQGVSDQAQRFLQKRCRLLTNDTVVLAAATISKTLPGGGAERRC